MGAGTMLVDILHPVFELMAPWMPGEVFPFLFTLSYGWRVLTAGVFIALVAAWIGNFLIVRNFSLLGEGLAHVSFAAVAAGIALGMTTPLWLALILSVVAAIGIRLIEERGWLSGDAAIAVLLCSTLAIGLLILQLNDEVISSDVEGYLFGSVLLISDASLDLIVMNSTIAMVSLAILHRPLLAITVDPVTARVQGIPVRWIGTWFSIIIAAVVVSLVQVTGALLISALLVTPAATGQMTARSFRGSIIASQAWGMSAIYVGLFVSAEFDTGSGAAIAIIALIQFIAVGIGKMAWSSYNRTEPNSDV